ncbi:hypothetical protein RJZ56_003651 [Blastomyces dermatitidis]|uniref:Uncharacterized protein n=3 Tax=Blastomyces TaxID=229219 RepID=A0A179U8R7_BLAGS|nr:uncharacterized protein BDBG_00253 [Blastomyces gilchristii SLH14081]XP_045272976.1 uncharacterized protein BDCG_08431 [Blastomyces dermatitidis ER-3]EGE78217.1 hypothetical protein BDDG_01154 [Blastomyces dermatitidis ATCC 18188]EQL31238.1 hypothetical protein BDFG_06411 [Blastomyces dermatitidis ATCC 26199]EEQ85162.1 hypothetical protein BDCG_08431 [Blastomyces dermatitidis ER-3]OAT03547.1 hypothetical protein BDBG_00253 [Blastomyces gilchristii SLH14081]
MKPLVILHFLALTAWALKPLAPRDHGDQTVIVVNKLAPDTHSYGYSGTNPVDGCWESLDCSLTQIEAMSMASRLEFIKYLSTWRLDALHSMDQFRAFEGVIAFFMRKDIGGTGTWLSLVHAACIEALQRGAAISLGLSSNTGGNPASEKWADYFYQRRTGRLTDRGAHDLSWAVAEQAAVDYGMRRADSSLQIEKPSGRVLRWMQFTRVYRTAMQYRRTILWLMRMGFTWSSPSIPMAVEAFIDWVTDVTDATSTGFLADVAWTLSALGLSQHGEDPAADSEVMLKIVTEFWEVFQLRNTGGGNGEQGGISQRR